MNFDLSEDQKTKKAGLKELTASWSAETLAELELGERKPLLAMAAALADKGYMGLEGDAFDQAVAGEVVATASPSLYLALEYGRLCARLVAAHGSPALKERILPELAAGKAIGTVAVCERNTSLDGNAPATTAKAHQGGMVLGGAKSAVVCATVADYVVVAASSEGGLVLAVLDAEAPCVTIGPRLATVGLDGAPMAELTMDGCLVPDEMVMGPLPAEALNELRGWEDAIMAMAALGVQKRAFAAARDYAKAHKSGGRPIIAYQEVGFKLAEMLTLVQSSQLLALRSAWLTADGDREAAITARSAKVYICEAAEKVASEAMQIFGAAGFTRGNAAEQGYRDAKYLTVAGTSSEISRMKIADTLLEWY